MMFNYHYNGVISCHFLAALCVGTIKGKASVLRATSITGQLAGPGVPWYCGKG